MANKHKRHSTSLAVREMQLKPVRHYYAIIKMVTIFKPGYTKGRVLKHSWEECEMVPTLENNLATP